SRRRHTRSKRDWSSDVCSSDLIALSQLARNLYKRNTPGVRSGKNKLVQASWLSATGCPTQATIALPNADFTGVGGSSTYTDPARSEERRVGKEGSCRLSAADSK